VDTSAISYRVADFLKVHPPFNVMDESDLLMLAKHGRVKFFEPNQYILSQGASRYDILVIQQGTVVLCDERSAEGKLLDVRGAGDMIGIDQFNEVRIYPYAARSASDVLIYAFPAEEFAALVQKYPDARRYVSAYDSVSAESRSAQKHRDPQNIFLREVAGRKFPACDAQASVREAAQQLLTTGGDAVAVLNSEQQLQAILTTRSFLEWIAHGNRDPEQPLTALIKGAPLTIADDASVAEGLLAMAAAGAGALAITSEGTRNGRVQAIVTHADLGRLFGERPLEILREISYARDAQTLRQLNHRARSVVQNNLTSATASDWLARFISSVDIQMMRRIVTLAGADQLGACWCFCGPSGRGETVTKLAPQVVMIADHGQNESYWLGASQRVLELLNESGYLPNSDRPFEPLFYAAGVDEWRTRYSDWVSDPILKEIYRARPLFDLRPVFGVEALWQELETTITNAINREFLFVLANDCLATLPPLTFFHNAVLDETGAETAVFRLEESALRPLVDVGRVFGMAAKRVLGSSTLDRLRSARALLPEHASIFEEASETLRILLWQQGRVGLSQGTAGSELPPALLGPFERQILRNGFRSILRLLEITGDLKWVERL